MKKRESILITDDSKIVVKSIEKALKKTDYDLLVANDGQECLDMIEKHSPKLVFLDIMLPKVHGIQVLRKLRENSKNKDMGVIVSTGRALLQDYQIAIDNGADYYLTKPFKAEAIGTLVSRYFSGNLKPDPLGTVVNVDPGEKGYYEPSTSSQTTYAKTWGTRGSIPVSGLDYYRYGGNTSCLEIRDGKHLIIVDAGSGIRALGDKVLEEGITDIHLVIGHTHWDHILGFPFFSPVYSPNTNINIYAAKGFHRNVEELFTGMLDHDYFPVRLDEMQANFTFTDLQDSRVPLEVGGIKLFYHYANHPGSTLCFKVVSENRTIGYASDNEFLLGYHGHPAEITIDHPLVHPYRSLVDFYQGCDTLIHEAQYTPQEYRKKVGWGHSSVSNAAVLMNLCRPKEWVATHHDPSHTDHILLEKLVLHRQALADCGLTTCSAHLGYDGNTFGL